MKYQLIALPALAATVAAQDLNSILGVLQTALPSSLVAEAITNSAAVGSEIASQFAAGSTPTWFSALPTDIQGYLVPTDLAGVSSLTAAASSLVSSASSAGLLNATTTPITTAPGVIGTGTLINNGSSVIAPNGTIIGNNNGTSAGNSSSTLSNGGSSRTTSGSSSETGGSGSGSGSGSNSGSESSTTASDAGAAMPTAFFGMGLAGALGVVGVLAL